MHAASVSVIVSARRISVVVAVFVLMVVVGISAYRSVSQAPAAEYQKALVYFGGRSYQVEIADTNEKRMKGLGMRDGIKENEGMLFVFEDNYVHCFWMKDVSFPIDIYWLNENYEVVDSIDSLSPETYPETFCPKKPVRYVLELAGGQHSLLEPPLKLQIEHTY